MKDEVRDAFGVVLKVAWQVVLAISVVGMMCNIGMKQLKLHTEIDKDWGRDDSESDRTDDHNWVFLSSKAEGYEYDEVPPTA
jgi:hypothetical protein